MTRPATRQKDIERAMKAALSVGLRVVGTDILPGGGVRVITADAVDAAPSPVPTLPPVKDREPNEWDEVLT